MASNSSRKKISTTKKSYSSKTISYTNSYNYSTTNRYSNNSSSYISNSNKSSSNSSYNYKNQNTISTTKNIISSTTTSNSFLNKTAISINKDIRTISSNINNIKNKAQKEYRKTLSNLKDKDGHFYKLNPNAHNNINTTTKQLDICLGRLNTASQYLKNLSNKKIVVLFQSETERIIKLVNNNKQYLIDSYKKLTEAEKNAQDNINENQTIPLLDTANIITDKPNKSKTTTPLTNPTLAPTPTPNITLNLSHTTTKREYPKLTGKPANIKGPRSIQYRLNNNKTPYININPTPAPAPTIKESAWYDSHSNKNTQKDGKSLLETTFNYYLNKERQKVDINIATSEMITSGIKNSLEVGKKMNEFLIKYTESAIRNNWKKIPDSAKYKIRLTLEGVNGFLDVGYKTESAVLNIVVGITGSEKLRAWVSTLNIENLRKAEEELLPYSGFGYNNLDAKIMFESTNAITKIILVDKIGLIVELLDTNGKYVQATYNSENTPSSNNEIRIQSLQTFIPTLEEGLCSTIFDSSKISSLKNLTPFKKIVSNIGLNTIESIASGATENIYKKNINNDNFVTLEDISLQALNKKGWGYVLSDQDITLIDNSGKFDESDALEAIKDVFHSVKNNID